METIVYDMLYFLYCGINGIKPADEIVGKYRSIQNQTTDENCINQNPEYLYQMSHAHYVDALTGTVLKQAGVKLPSSWEQSIGKAVRKVILFDSERKKITSFMEQQGIWYLPLKGIILKDDYPLTGMRQMSDNDILFDASYAEVLRDYMISIGYTVEAYGIGNHDIYKKEPIYNFELHRSLYGAAHDNNWQEYYGQVKQRLIRDTDNSYGYHMKEEDFYIYIMCHGYKHYKGSGTGIRTLLDYYVYLCKHRQSMDFAYIERECDILGIADFEKKNRELCGKVFGRASVWTSWETVSWKKKGALDALKSEFSALEWEMLQYYLTSGVYGTSEHMISNQLKKCTLKNGRISKLRYIRRRLFPGKEVYGCYPFLEKHRWLVPGFWIYRMIRMVLGKESRHRILKEVKLVRDK